MVFPRKCSIVDLTLVNLDRVSCFTFVQGRGSVFTFCSKVETRVDVCCETTTITTKVGIEILEKEVEERE